MIVAGETCAGVIVGGITVAGDNGSGEEPEPTDPLAALDDEFQGVTLDADWLSYEPGTSEVQTAVADSELDFTCNLGGVGNSFWYMLNQGIVLYKAVTGDFDMIAGVRLRNSADSGLPTVGDGNYRIAGICAHDPDRSTQLNYVHVGMGCIATADIQVEIKNTIDGNSFFDPVTPTGADTGIGELRIRRIANVFTLFYRPDTESAWAQVGEYDRTAVPMPTTLHLGFMAYSNDGVLPNADVRLFVDYVHFTTPGFTP